MKDDVSIYTSKDSQKDMRRPIKRQSSVKSTLSLHKFKKSGETMINQYALKQTIGKGSFGTVKLC